MKHRFVTLIPIVAFLIATTTLGLVLRGEAQIFGNVIKLSDLTDDPVPRDMIIAYMPPTVDEYVLNGREIGERVARALGVNVSYPPEIKVMRVIPEGTVTSLTFTFQDIQRSVEKTVVEYLSSTLKNLKIPVHRLLEVDVPDSFDLPENFDEFHVRVLTRFRSSLFLQIRYLRSGHTVFVDSVRVNANLPGKVVVMRRNVKVGEVLTAEDATLTSVNLLEFDSYVISLEEVVGMQVTKSFKAQEIVDPRFLRLPPLVRRGQILQALYMDGGIVIRTFVRAMEDGTAGQYILTRHVKTGRIVYGILGKDRVLLVPPPREVSER